MRVRIGYPAPDQEKAILQAERSILAIEHLKPVFLATM
jgi:hypothetical protein